MDLVELKMKATILVEQFSRKGEGSPAVVQAAAEFLLSISTGSAIVGYDFTPPPYLQTLENFLSASNAFHRRDCGGVTFRLESADAIRDLLNVVNWSTCIVLRILPEDPALWRVPQMRRTWGFRAPTKWYDESANDARVTAFLSLQPIPAVEFVCRFLRPAEIVESVNRLLQSVVPMAGNSRVAIRLDL